MNRYKLHLSREELEPKGTYSCNKVWDVADLRPGDFLSVEWSKVSCGIPNGYQCYVLKINEDSIDVLVEEQPATNTGWCYDTIPKKGFAERFWSNNIHRRNVDMKEILEAFKENNVTIHPRPIKATMLFGMPIKNE